MILNNNKQVFVITGNFELFHGCWLTLFWDRSGQVVGDAVHYVRTLFSQNSHLLGSMFKLIKNYSKLFKASDCELCKSNYV
jgi:hypothetical protein